MQTETKEEILCYDSILKTLKEGKETGGTRLKILVNKRLKDYKLSINDSTYNGYLRKLIEFGFITGNYNSETNKTDYGLIKYGPLSIIDYITFSDNKDKYIIEQVDFLRNNDFQPAGKKYPFHFIVMPNNKNPINNPSIEKYARKNYYISDEINEISRSFHEDSYVKKSQKKPFNIFETDLFNYFSSMVVSWIFLLFLGIIFFVIKYAIIYMIPIIVGFLILLLVFYGIMYLIYLIKK